MQLATRSWFSRLTIVCGLAGTIALPLGCSGEPATEDADTVEGDTGSSASSDTDAPDADATAAPDTLGAPKTCTGPEVCDDGIPCTLDSCGSDGLCFHHARDWQCAGEICLPDRGCGCLTDADCDDEILCTVDTCDGRCTHTPDDSACGAGEVCASEGEGLLIACIEDRSCSDHAECFANYCDPTHNECGIAPCNDGERNGLETDIDCGSSWCPQCEVGQGCATGDDCASRACGADGRCAWVPDDRFASSMCAGLCDQASDCGRIADLGGDSCMDACKASLVGADLASFAKLGCLAARGSCSDFDTCLQPVSDHADCASLCAAVDSCGLYDRFDVPRRVDVCTAFCSGAATADAGTLAALPCVAGALGGGQCDGMAARACVGLEPTCGDACGFVDADCSAGDPVLSVFSDSAACGSACGTLAVGPAHAFDVCVAQEGCGTTGCDQVPAEPAAGCTAACDQVFDLCPRFGYAIREPMFGTALVDLPCPWWCTGVAHARGSTDIDIASCVQSGLTHFQADHNVDDRGCNPVDYEGDRTLWQGLFSMCLSGTSPACESLCAGLKAECPGGASIAACEKECSWIEHVEGRSVANLQSCVDNAATCTSKGWCVFPCDPNSGGCL
ncbi:MAG: hypothetical protein EP329_27015 [Deltaproteobacteria bacterium]|nr:MAG: hypothetical protein EP329_27015 [Deltaproteobacteria bacterium]